MSSSLVAVVGYDGSPSARAALAFASERAGGGKVFVVHAYDAPRDFWGTEHYEELLERALQRGRSILDGITADDSILAGVEYEVELIAGRPAEAALARVARAAGGSR